MKKQMSEWMNKPNKWIKYYYLNEFVFQSCVKAIKIMIKIMSEWAFHPPPCWRNGFPGGWKKNNRKIPGSGKTFDGIPESRRRNTEQFQGYSFWINIFFRINWTKKYHTIQKIFQNEKRQYTIWKIKTNQSGKICVYLWKKCLNIVLWKVQGQRILLT